MSRTVTINGKDIEVRGLKRKEIKEQLKKYGFRSSSYLPVKDADGKVDLDLAEEGQDKVLDIILGDRIDEIDEMGGNAAFQDIFIEIIAETYGSPGEEKNLSTPGGENPTEKESSTAETAEK